MPTNAARSPLTPGHRRRAIALGAVFVGSSLVAVMSPAYAEPSPSGGPSGSAPPSTSSPSRSASPTPSPTESPDPSPEPPVVSAVIDFGRDSDDVELGERPPDNPLTVTNTGDASICLTGLTVNATGFGVEGFTPQEVAPDDSVSAGTVTGAARETTDVVATLTYALAREGVDCAVLDPATEHNVATGAWTVSVVEPDPSPEPTPSPTKEPSPEPTEEPDENGGDEGGGDKDETTPPDETSDPSEGGDDQTGGSGGSEGPENAGGSGGSGDSGGSGNAGGSSGSSGGVDDVPTSDVPTSDDTSGLPSDEADLPGVIPGAENLAELPTVTPGSPEEQDDDVDGTEVAASHSDLGPNMAPAVLLAAFLLALLLAAPLAPARRVRVGGGYQGRRRRR